MINQKKVFSCIGTEDSPHPKVFFTSDFKDNNIIKNSCDNKVDYIKDSKKDNISCPYCGKEFNFSYRD